jgi:hypothetical protein
MIRLDVHHYTLAWSNNWLVSYETKPVWDRSADEVHTSITALAVLNSDDPLR